MPLGNGPTCTDTKFANQNRDLMAVQGTGFSRIEGAVGLDLGNDRCIESMRAVKLINVRLGYLGLLRTGRKNRRAVLATYVRPLAVEFGRIVATEK